MTNHKQKYGQHSCESRKIVCDQLKKKLFQQKSLFTSETKQQEEALLASYFVTYELMKAKKRYYNVKDIIANCSYFSIALDESIDVLDTNQLLEALCAKSIKLSTTMATVTKITNLIRGGNRSLTHRKFLTLLEEMDSAYGDLLLHTEVRWLSRGKCLNDLEDVEFLRNLAFLTDITQHLNVLNLQLQGKKQTMSDEEEEEEGLEFRDYTEIIEDLSSEFDRRFNDFESFRPDISLFSNPIHCDIESQPGHLQLELCELQCDPSLNTSQVTGIDFWKLLSPERYPLLRNWALKLCSVFASTYICETYSARSQHQYKMAAPLETCTREEQRSVIRFLRSEGVKPIEIYRRMKFQYGDACLSQQQVYEWSRKFANGVTSVENAPRPELLRRFEQEGDDFLARIVTGDETWVHFHQPETKRASKEWRHSSAPKPKEFRTRPSAGKVMLTLFLGRKRHHLGELHAWRDNYHQCIILRSPKNHLRPAIKSKRCGLLTTGILLQHDNARPHAARTAVATISDLHFVCLPHPAYSPDLAPSDFHMFGPLKEAMGGKTFRSVRAQHESRMSEHRFPLRLRKGRRSQKVPESDGAVVADRKTVQVVQVIAERRRHNLVSYSFLHESLVWLVRNNHIKKANDVIRWLWGPSHQVEERYTFILYLN
ncbi:hypothetical protein B7P43_G14049 [Cryptotermes secundus]|uniref:Mos1 transposase HTH domain-containing protein n=1 Tax=Cryptotermes secundus TaxID=105785 RepID=A0A2J7QKE8_9NEOP|nr:hypothetical protein B7P43_G14049 [Cryptotermes secundus]